MIFFFLVSSLVDIDLNLTSAVSELAEIPGAGREVDMRFECVCVWGLSFSNVLVTLPL